MVDVVVVNAVVGVVQTVHCPSSTRVVFTLLLLLLLTHCGCAVVTLGSMDVSMSGNKDLGSVVAEDGLVEVGGLEGAAHSNVPVEGEVHGLRQEVSQFVPEARVAPLDNRTILEQVLEVGILSDLLGRDVLQLDKDHLGVVVHDAGDEWGANLGPLQAEVGSGEDDEGAGAGLHGHGDRIIHGGRGGKVPLVKAKSVARVSVLQVRRKTLLDKVPVCHGVAANRVTVSCKYFKVPIK